MPGRTGKGWQGAPTVQRASVRGFISTAAKKNRIKIESAKNEAVDRVYKIAM